MFGRAVVFGAVAALIAGPALAGVVLQDNFNSDTQALNWPGDSVFTSTSPPGSVDLIGTGFFDVYPGNGNYVDMDGSTGIGHNPAGQLTSVLTFGPGAYSLSFDLGGNARGGVAQTTNISLGDFSTNITLNSADGLANHVFSFVTGTSGHLVFTEQGPSDNIGNILDNVTLSTVGGGVPEPGAWALMLTGFLGLGAMLRRRRRRAGLAA